MVAAVSCHALSALLSHSGEASVGSREEGRVAVVAPGRRGLKAIVVFAGEGTA